MQPRLRSRGFEEEAEATAPCARIHKEQKKILWKKVQTNSMSSITTEFAVTTDLCCNAGGTAASVGGKKRIKHLEGKTMSLQTEN